MSKEYIQALDDLFGLVAFQEGFGRAQKYFDIIEEALNRLESIDNANTSEALKDLERIGSDYFLGSKDCLVKKIYEKEYNNIKQALLKVQEPKQYLTWETLPFKKKSPECPRGIVKLNAKMGDTPLKVFCSYSKDGIHHYVEIYRVINDTLYIFMNLLDDESDEEYKLEPQLFNDLHLEVVENE